MTNKRGVDLMHIESQKVLPAVSNFKALKIFLQSDIEYCILMDFQLAELEDIVIELKSHHKKVLIHIDLIKGLTPNEFGAIYLIQKLKIDGIISTKYQALLLAKKRNIIAIQRIFLKDSLSLDKSLDVVNKVHPDYLEILPAISNVILETVIKRTNLKVFCGGLIQNKSQVDECLQNGATGITTSKTELWNI
jgi:glycerol uptake operon antiterminator